MEALNEKIKRLRGLRGLSQDELATKCGVSRVAVTKWESGATENLKLGNLILLAKALQTTINDLLEVEEVAGHRVQENNVDYSLIRNTLTTKELAIVEAYRAAEPKLKTAIFTMLSAIEKPTQVPAETVAAQTKTAIIYEEPELTLNELAKAVGFETGLKPDKKSGH